MVDAPRYAIYFVPATESQLHRFGAAVIGYDAYSGGSVEAPEFASPAWRELTREPRKYGFHATLKAPFRLAPDAGEAALLAEVDAFAAEPRAVPVIDLTVAAIGAFIALVPREPNAALHDLAAECVTAFDALRAPLTAEDRKRRLASALTKRQETHLEHWGYPYVFEDFRFHMTLTGRVPDAAERERIVGELAGAFARACDEPTVAVDRVAVLRQDRRDVAFRVMRTAVLRGRG